jgi:hypothetical protein
LTNNQKYAIIITVKEREEKLMDKYYVYRDGWCYTFVFYNIKEACEMCRQIGGDCVVNAETGEVVAEREG